MRLVIVNIMIFLVLKLLWLFSPAVVEEMVGVLTLPAAWANAVKVPWTLLTYSFVHVDFWHLLINCLWLAWFGTLLKEIAGTRWVLTNFFAGAIAGALCFIAGSAVYAPQSNASLIGASAAVFAVVSATMISAPSKRVKLAYIGSFSLRAIAAVGMALFFLASLEMAPSQTAAHVGGIAVGVVASLVWRRYTRRHIASMKSVAKTRLEHLSLVEKVNRNGYSSLTREEQLRLFNLTTARSATSKKENKCNNSK
jgi:membrane associated rhomboid family serine protease